MQRFDPFGAPIDPASESADAATKNIRAGFTGHETDVETGLVNMGGRVYDPRVGRFMQADPILQPGWSQTLNRYSYVTNNPLNAVDPTGFCADCDDEDPDDRTHDEGGTAPSAAEAAQFPAGWEGGLGGALGPDEPVTSALDSTAPTITGVRQEREAPNVAQAGYERNRTEAIAEGNFDLAAFYDEQAEMNGLNVVGAAFDVSNANAGDTDPFNSGGSGTETRLGAASEASGGEAAQSALAGFGLGTHLSIPVPGGLSFGYTPNGWTPKAGTTSALFLQNASGKQHLRLDHGFNKGTGLTEYHWNQKGTFETFGIPNHTPAGPSGKFIYHGAQVLRVGGHYVFVTAVAMDAVSIATADDPLQQSASVAGGWGGAYLGGKGLGALGALGGTAVAPGPGTAIGGAVGGIVGAGVGYWGGSQATEAVYTWIESNF